MITRCRSQFKRHYCLLIFVVFFVLNVAPAAFSMMLPTGNSAYLYGQEDQWTQQIKAFNKTVAADAQFRYLFPLVGKVSIPSGQQQLQVHYNPSVTAFYKQRLPKVLILANISYWVKKSHFTDWSKANYIKAADQIAALILNDSNADGVHLDIEVYSDKLLPFYHELANKLAKGHKIIALFAAAHAVNPALLNALGSNGMIVLYGYDLRKPSDHAGPVSPDQYQQRLSSAIKLTLKQFNYSGAHLMVGIPAVATTYEWGEKHSCHHGKCEIAHSGFSQQAYFAKALAEVNAIHHKQYLGYAVWAFVKDKAGQPYFPLDISPEEWRMMSSGVASDH